MHMHMHIIAVITAMYNTVCIPLSRYAHTHISRYTHTHMYALIVDTQRPQTVLSISPVVADGEVREDLAIVLRVGLLEALGAVLLQPVSVWLRAEVQQLQREKYYQNLNQSTLIALWACKK